MINIKSWDEAIYANNAVEMNKNGNWWVMYRDGQPDFYNTKPPLVIWLQSIFISIFGLTEIAIRLPSFISLLVTVVVLFRFLQKWFHSSLLSLFSISVLLTSYGFLGFHGVATGDLDATLCLWITLFSITILDKVVLPEKKISPKWVYIIGLFFVLGFLSKSSAVFLPLPGLLISVFTFKKQDIVFKNKHFYFVLFAIIAFITVYYVLMEIKFPGYFHHAWASEYKRIYYNVMPWHSQPFFYYIKNFSERFFPWCWLIIPSIVLGLLSKKILIKKLTLFSAIFCITYTIIVSIPAVKLDWYDLPLYPFLAILTGIFFSELYDRTVYLFSNNPLFKPITAFIFLAIAVPLFISMLNNIKHPLYKEPLEKEGIALKQLINDYSVSNLKILMRVDHPEHYSQLNFYREVFLKKRGYKPELIFTTKQLSNRDTILVCQIALIDSIKKLKSVSTIKKVGDCLLISVGNN
ncbi:MAG: glycosyltransferase family 39 protein [Chitinophagaceae bacterium]